MTNALDLWEQPEADEIYMLAGWQQWADAGSISSGLPRYWVQRLNARKIGEIRPDGFYLFQFPGTHGLVRPIIRFKEGYPEALRGEDNEIFYAEHKGKGLVFFLGSEPHMDIERYTKSFLEIMKVLKVKRAVSFGGVYGELPYEKERMVSGTYSLERLKEEMATLSVRLSDYQGGASIGSYICKRAGEQDLEYVTFYAFAPTYDFSEMLQMENSIRIENDFLGWYGVMRRVNHMLKLELDLEELELKSQKLLDVMDEKVDELDKKSPQLGIKAYFERLSEEYEEVSFNPLDDGLEEQLSKLFDKFEGEEE